MTITLSTANRTNIETTLNAWFQARMAEFARPGWFGSLPTIAFEFPVEAAVMPCWSLTHIPIPGERHSTGDAADSVRGTKGVGVQAFIWVTAWLNKAESKNYRAMANLMMDFVRSAVLAAPSILVMDYVTDQTTPATTPWIVHLNSFEETGSGDDPRDANLWRKDGQIRYSYIARV